MANRLKISALILFDLTLTLPALAEVTPVELAATIKVYVYRSGVFADRYLGLGIPADRSALGGRPWYVRLDRSVRAQASIETLANLVSGYQIPGIDFTGDRSISTGEIEHLLQPSLANLRILKLSGTMLDDRILATLASASNLEVLELGDRVTDQGLKFLKKLKRLRVVTLTGSGITDASATTLAQWSELERLNLKGSRISDEGIKVLRSHSLKELSLGAAATNRTLETMEGMTTLEQLDLSQAQVTGNGLAKISALDGIHTLFLGPSFADPDVEFLLRFKYLKRLDLTGAHLTDRSGQPLAQMTQIEELALTRTGITAATLTELARLPHLRYLEISEIPIDLKNLKRLPVFPKLQVISISSTHRLRAEDLAALARWPRLHSILVNGVLLGPRLLEELRSREHSMWHILVPDVEAAGSDIDDVLEIASRPLEDKSTRRFSGFEGLKRVHEAEASLEDVVSAPSNIMQDTFQENEKNFLGEITVGVVREKKKK